MTADDMACNPRNPLPAQLFNNESRKLDVYGQVGNSGTHQTTGACTQLCALATVQQLSGDGCHPLLNPQTTPALSGRGGGLPGL